MPREFTDLSKVRHVRAGDPVAELPTAQPTRALELRLQQLEQVITSLTQTGAFGRLIIRDVLIKTGSDAVTLDSVVYYNANTGLYERALAGVTYVTGNYSSNPSALSLGVCVAVNGSRGDVMIAGYDNWRDAAHRHGMLESTEEFVPGVPYYLSDDEPGKVTRYPPTLRMQVFLGTDEHYILQPSWSSPEAVDTLYRAPMGMRPVGGLRSLPPDYEQQVIVGFDGLELVDATAGLNVWQPTIHSDVSAIRNFGWLVADAAFTAVLDTPVYVRISVAVGGAITVRSALSVAALYSGGAVFNEVSGLQALTAGTSGTLRTYSVMVNGDAEDAVGELWFKFTSDDTTVRRDAVFKLPDSFQGWKMVNAPVTPVATAVVSGGGVVAIDLAERGVGYLAPPKVVITGTGTITTPAEAVAVLDDAGSIAEIQVTETGAGYVTASVAFDTQLDEVWVGNGGDGEADITAGQTGGEIDVVTIVDGGTLYNEVPSLMVTDPTGTGAILQASITAGVITGVEIVSQGSGYTAPRVIVRPSGVGGYIRTTPGIFTATVAAGAVTGVAVVADGSNGLTGGWGYPLNPSVTFTDGSPTTPAAATATVDPVTRRVTAITVTNPGAGYTSTPTVTVAQSDPLLVVTQGTPTLNGAGTIACPPLRLRMIQVRAAGYGYSPATTMVCTGGLNAGGTAALVRPEVDATTGSIVGVHILHPGINYHSPPTLTITDPGGTGNGFRYEVTLDTWPAEITLTEAGSGFHSNPALAPGVPIGVIEVEDAGQGYVTAPTISVEPPDLEAGLGGVTATAVARLGGSIRSIRIVAPGSGYVNATATVVGGGGTDAEVAVGLAPDGSVATVEVVKPGYGFTSVPSLTVAGFPGSGAIFEVTLENTDGQIARIDLVTAGHGYTRRPQVTIAVPPDGGIHAVAQAKLAGEGSGLAWSLHGDGGIHFTQTADLAVGNALQVRDYNDDLNDTPAAAYSRPDEAVFYYNIKTDPVMLSRWPAVPLDKSLFMLNGTEQEATTFNEATGLLGNPRADIIFTRKTPMWPTFDADGCPWDREYRQLVRDLGAEGADAVIPDTGPTSDAEDRWLFWEHVFKYEPNRNTAHMHINRASRFHQSGRLSALGALAPLRLIDALTGTEARNDGTLMTGQLLLTLDNQVNFLGGTGSQITTTLANQIVAIYQNNTSRPVFISSVMFQVVHQLNGVALPSVADAALITVGTREGSYRDIIGTIDPVQVTQQGRPTGLYRLNTIKELFPDDRESSPVIMPNQTVYARVDSPANTATIQTQVLVARLKGHVL